MNVLIGFRSLLITDMIFFLNILRMSFIIIRIIQNVTLMWQEIRHHIFNGFNWAADFFTVMVREMTQTYIQILKFFNKSFHVSFEIEYCTCTIKWRVSFFCLKIREQRWRHFEFLNVNICTYHTVTDKSVFKMYTFIVKWSGVYKLPTGMFMFRQRVVNWNRIYHTFSNRIIWNMSGKKI